MRKTSQEVVGQLGELDDRIVFVGSDLGPEVLPSFRKKFPERYFMEGISEQHIVGMAAGLAMDGFRPFVHTFSTFLSRRALEQIAIDVCLHNLPVRFLAVGGGVSHASLGPTHCATDDLALLRPLPNLSILTPCDAPEVSRLIEATQEIEGPVYIRLARGNDPHISSMDSTRIGKAIPLKPPQTIAIVACGVMTQRAMLAAEELATRGIAVGVLHIHTLKPFDADGLLAYVSGARLVVTLEEHVRVGGLGSAVLEVLADRRRTDVLVVRLGFPDAFVSGYGSQEQLLEKYGLDAENVVRVIAAEAERVRLTPVDFGANGFVG